MLAGCASACLAGLSIRSIAGKHPDAVCTIGSVKTFPGIVTAVVGRCEAALDQRDLDPGVLASMYREAREASEGFAAILIELASSDNPEVARNVGGVQAVLRILGQQ